MSKKARIKKKRDLKLLEKILKLYGLKRVRKSRLNIYYRRYHGVVKIVEGEIINVN